MKGQIAITKWEVENNEMGWNVFDFFKEILKHYSTSARAGWYAYILRDGIYYFLWTDSDISTRPSKKYLNLLKRYGYNIPYTTQDNFNISIE